MAQWLYCWRCKIEVPMLNEQEWEQIIPADHSFVKQVQRYHIEHSASLAEAKDQVSQQILDKYFALTQYRETDINAFWHHRASQYGPPCQYCGKPLRTPRAHYCAACGKLSA